MVQLGKYVEHQIRKENHQVKTQRMEARKQELKVDWVTGGGKNCYRAAKEQGQPPTLVLSRRDGTLTAHPGEIHALVEEVWGKGVFNKKDCSKPREDSGGNSGEDSEEDSEGRFREGSGTSFRG